MNQYTIVTAMGTDNLIPKVVELINQGWQPLGGVCVATATVINGSKGPGAIGFYAYQAMVRE